jgi:rSAM/selenodomain-associated transferase 2
MMRISVIIPALNEESIIASTLEAVRPLAPDEVLVVDGGSTDQTREIVACTDATLTSSARGRAEQMNHGARLARGDVFLFLHADTRLPRSALRDIRSALEDPQWVGGRFDVRLEGDHRIYGLIGALINLRSRLTKVATGDQAIFVRREVYEEIGGFPNLPLIEDIAFSRSLKKKGKVACLKSQVATSARRWEREGIWQTVLRMWALRILYLAGVSPYRLKRFYSDAR